MARRPITRSAAASWSPTGTVRAVVDEAAAPLFSDVALTKAARRSDPSVTEGSYSWSSRSDLTGNDSKSLASTTSGHLGTSV